MGLVSFLVIYFFGGITLIPGLLVLILYLHPYKSDEQEEQKQPLKAGEIEETNQSGLESYKSGWIFVTRDYLDSPDQINSNTQPITESNDNKSAYSSLYKLVSDDAATAMSSTNSQSTENDDLSINESKETLIQPPPTTRTGAGSTATATGTTPVRSSQRRHRYYAVLKHGNLFLYKDETLKDVKHVIVLSNYFVTIYPRELTDSQFFTKYSAIALINPNKLTNSNDDAPPKGSFFIYCDINSDKEDWYFTLIRASKLNTSELPDLLNPNFFAKTLHFNTKDMINLIQTLYSSEGQLQTKWLNAIIGRIFLGLQGTKLMEDYIRNKLNKKLNKIKTPGFLDKFQIKEISPGSSAPFFTYPNLQEINPDGTIVVGGYVSYSGGLSVTISTKVNINFGAKFTNREVDILLRVVLNRFEGPILIKIKPQPSARIWYSYKTEPIMNISIEPVISSRQVAYNIITNYMEKKLKEAIKESLVLPHWDDIVFFETMDELYRGGIWEQVKPESSTSGDQTSGSTTPSEEVSIDPSMGPSEEPSDEDDDIETRSELSVKLANQKVKLTNTLTDISKRMKKKTSSGVDDTNHNTTTVSPTMNTLKKIGKWYFKDEKQQSQSFPQQPQQSPKNDEHYTAPEMISNRRPPRKSSNVSVESKPNDQQPSYDFGKFNQDLPGHTTTTTATVTKNWPDNISVISGDGVSSELLVSEPTVGLTHPPPRHKSIRKPPMSPPPPLPEDLEVKSLKEKSNGKISPSTNTI
ncbi:putative PH domain-containing protein [Spathaspora sp. JA1]|nr:putative PH domain-containing protein [Spathaspora sp. JA1]